MENFSHAQVASRFGRIDTVSDIDLEVNETGFQSDPSFWRSTAPNPYDEASADTFNSLSGSYKARVVSFDSSSSRPGMPDLELSSISMRSF